MTHWKIVTDEMETPIYHTKSLRRAVIKAHEMAELNIPKDKEVFASFFPVFYGEGKPTLCIKRIKGIWTHKEM